MTRTFQTLKEVDLYNNEGALVGKYLPGFIYTCRDSSAVLSEALDAWLADGTAKLFERKAGHASLGGVGEVK